MSIKKDIRHLFHEIIDFVKEDFNPWAYGWAAVFVASLVVFSYVFNGYDKFILPLFYNKTSWYLMPLLYIAVWYLVSVPNLLIRKEYHTLRDWRFWVKPAAFIALMSVAISYSVPYQWFRNDSLTRIDTYFLRTCWVYFDGILLVVVPLAIYKYLFDRDIKGIYGLCSNKQYLNVYLFALLCLLPFVAAASFLPDFQAYYPRFRPDRMEGALGMPMWGVTAVFETCYGLDFLTTEVFFRGAMVIGLASILGPRAVLPMAVFYCTVHFGKPCLESVSAIFGGYILGILANRTKHIWGGVCAHLGIAFMMEIMGLIHLFARMG